MNRLTKITTRNGDQGQTGLGDGSRVKKDSLRIQVLGDIDELNAALGLVKTYSTDSSKTLLIAEIQQRLFDLGGELAIPESIAITSDHVLWLEQQLEQINGDLPALKEFILPGGEPASAHAHLARAICRRAERSLWRLSRQESVNSESLIYLNRLSDLLFVLARALARQSSTTERTWNRET
ncbi:cob(I)yrinic acid a,c-diamide adenosyltransferase [Thiolapillus sp.]